MKYQFYSQKIKHFQCFATNLMKNQAFFLQNQQYFIRIVIKNVKCLIFYIYKTNNSYQNHVFCMQKNKKKNIKKQIFPTYELKGGGFSRQNLKRFFFNFFGFSCQKTNDFDRKYLFYNQKIKHFRFDATNLMKKPSIFFSKSVILNQRCCKKCKMFDFLIIKQIIHIKIIGVLTRKTKKPKKPIFPTYELRGRGCSHQNLKSFFFFFYMLFVFLARKPMILIGKMCFITENQTLCIFCNTSNVILLILQK